MLRHHTISPFIPVPIFRMYQQWGRGGNPPWHAHCAIRADFADQIGIIDRAARDLLPFDTPIPSVTKLLRIHDLHAVTCEMGDWYGKIRAHFGIDTRPPTLDRRLAEFCIGVPEDQFLRNGRQRWLIRRAMQGRLSDPVLHGTKRGAQASDWFSRLTRERKQIAEELKRLTGNPEVSSIVDLPRLIEVLDHWPDQEPEIFSGPQRLLMWIPQALGAAKFIENVTGANRIDPVAPMAVAQRYRA